jgi:uncharacterized membrane protein (DUF106 family)
MLEAINSFFVTIGGYLFDWLLPLGQDAALVLVAVITSAILTFVRPFTTPQALLARCKRDKKVLARRMKAARARRAIAKAAGDKQAAQAAKEELGRLRIVVGRVGMKQATAEGKPLLVAIVPLILVFVWAADRLAFVPPADGEQVVLRAYFPKSAVREGGPPAHLVLPQGGELTVADGRAVQDVHLSEDKLNGEIDWLLKARARPEPYHVRIYYKGRVYEKSLRVGDRINAPVLEFYDHDLECVELRLPPKKLFGVLGIPEAKHLPLWLLATVPVVYGVLFCLSWFPAWMLGYLLIAIPFVFVLKGVFRIH